MARHQRTRIKNIDAHLYADEVRRLLSHLCVDLGFCLPSTEIEKLSEWPPTGIDEFTQTVLVAEGYGAYTSDPLFKNARELVAQAFVDHRARRRTEFRYATGGPKNGGHDAAAFVGYNVVQYGIAESIVACSRCL